MKALIKRVKHLCKKLVSDTTNGVFPYHNLQHTLEVFNNVQIIGKHENISNEDMGILEIAALFHDTGFNKKIIGHELVSASNAKYFLEKAQYPKHNTELVISCILATEMPQNPKTKLECIICDADLFHLSSPNYWFKSELLRNEWEINLNLNYTDEQWHTLNLNFLRNHTYFTSYGQTVLEEKKLNNCYLIQQPIS